MELWIGVIGAGILPLVRASAALPRVTPPGACATLYRLGRGGGLVLPALPVDEVGPIPLLAASRTDHGVDDIVTHLYETWEYTGSSPATTTVTIFASTATARPVSAVLYRLGIRSVDADYDARDIAEAVLRGGIGPLLFRLRPGGR